MTAHPYMPNSTPRARAASCSRPSAPPTSRSCSRRSRPRTACRARSTCRRRSPPRPRCGGTCSTCSRATRPASATSASSAAASGSTTCRRSATRSCGRSEFLTPVWGTPSSDHGRNQAWFEFASQLGELVGMDFVGLPVYSWGCAAGHAIRMAARLTGRSAGARAATDRARSGSPSSAPTAAAPSWPGTSRSSSSATTPTTGGLDLADLERRLSARTAAVLFENPVLPRRASSTTRREIAALARAARRRDDRRRRPDLARRRSRRPSDYGADIVVGTTQPLGVHMHCGGGVGRLHRHARRGALRPRVPDAAAQHRRDGRAGEYGFGIALFEQTSYGCARRATTGPATRSTSGRSRTPSTWR